MLRYNIINKKRRMQMHAMVLLFILSCAVGNLYAQDGSSEKVEITTDRPDQTESATLIPVGSLQVETGFMMEGTSVGKDFTYNTTLIKYGINENFEFRFIQEVLGSKVNDENGEISTTGANPMSIGAKIKIADAKGWIPQTAFIGHITFPTGSDGFNTNYVTSDFRLTMEYDLSPKFSMGVNLGAEGDGETPFTTGIYTFVIGYSITDKMGMFTEVYGFITEKETSGVINDHRFNGGFTYKISNVVQYDISAGIGLSDISADYFLSTGLSFRLFK